VKTRLENAQFLGQNPRLPAAQKTARREKRGIGKSGKIHQKTLIFEEKWPFLGHFPSKID
jgi:hypothetical protein